MLTQTQIDEFWQTGVLVVENAVTPDQLNSLRTDFDGWVEESRSHENNFGTIIDGRARFDLEAGHTADQPALRRVNASPLPMPRLRATAPWSIWLRI